MSLVALLLFILACGWNVYRDYFPTRIVAIRAPGHPQHFGAVLATAFVFMLAACIHAAAMRSETYLQHLISLSALVPQLPDKNAGNAAVELLTFRSMLAIAFWSGVLSMVLPWLMNLPFRLNSRLNLDVAWPRLDEVEQLLVEVSQEKIDLAVTLSTGKVYIGTPLDVDIGPKEKTAWVRLRPVASGFRNERGELVATTVYEDIYGPLRDAPSGSLGVDHFSVLLPLSAVVCLQRFNFELFTRNLLASLEAANAEAEDTSVEGISNIEIGQAREGRLASPMGLATKVGDNDEQWAEPWDRWASKVYLLSLTATAVSAALCPWAVMFTLLFCVFSLLRMSESRQSWWRSSSAM